MGLAIDHAGAIAATLPRSYESLERDQVKFRVWPDRHNAFSRDETIMGFGFPREEREALVVSGSDDTCKGVNEVARNMPARSHRATTRRSTSE